MSESRRNKGSIFKTRSQNRGGSVNPNSRKAKRLKMKKDRLSHLPKSRFERYKFYATHPKELGRYWFSAEGRWMFLKILLGLVGFVIAAFIVFYISVASEVRGMTTLIEERIQTTTNKYVDRNGELLWEDTGSGDILKFVESDQMAQSVKDATVAIEDKDFYAHGGVSVAGILRATLNNFTGGSTQGGSTLTQQLMKQVFFADEAGERGIAGIPRKIKEAILAIEAERIYTKDEILTYYLNVAPYGGRRNGVQSASETYFGKDAKDLTLSESALLAAIPQSPTVYNPYNTEWNGSLIERQTIILNYMHEQFPDKYSAEQIATAKTELTVDNLKDVLQPADALLTDATAPHFVQMVKADLENELGVKVVGQGGLTITTTLDIRVQNIIDENVNRLFASNLPTSMGFDNAAATMVDSQTGQILGMRGSRDYNFPDYGAVNAATSFIQPGSSIKPEVFASLIDTQRDAQTYGAGSIIPDNPIPQNIYTTSNGRSVQNADGAFRGNITLRQGLAESRNIPAIMAMSYNGIEETKDKMREMGDLSYCTDGVDQSVGLASAIGGCGAIQVEHANAFATFARMGKYVPYSSVLTVKDFQGNLLYENDIEEESTQVIDPQTAYIINDILTDANARTGTFGYCPTGFCINGVKTATKTGQSDMGGMTKDIWVMSYTPKASFSIWYGNHVPATLNYGNSLSPGPVVADIVGRTHKEVFAPDGTWKEGDWFAKPEGIQTLTVNGRTDLFPSWYIKDNIQVTTEPAVFDKFSKKLATECTPDGSKETIDIIKTVNISNNTTSYQVPDGYNRDAYDDVHSCDDRKPNIDTVTASETSPGSGRYAVRASINPGSNARHTIISVTFTINGKAYQASDSTGTNYWEAMIDIEPGYHQVTVNVTDEIGYSAIPAAPMVSFP